MQNSPSRQNKIRELVCKKFASRHFWCGGKKIVFGIDEVGRGPLAGPVFAVALTCPANPKSEFLISKQSQKSKVPEGEQAPYGAGKNIIRQLADKIKNRDSKKLSAKQREKVYKLLRSSPWFVWGTGIASERIIDKINILQATKLAMEKAVLSLEKKVGKQADMLLIDGNFGIGITRPQQSIIKGDEKIFLISLASIIAKVERDNLMQKMHKKYPQYGFDKHKGYGTKQHYEMIAKYGACKIHRQTFRLISHEA